MEQGRDRGGSWAVDLISLGFGVASLYIEGAGNLRISGFSRSPFFQPLGALVKTGLHSLAGKPAMRHVFLVRLLTFGSFWNMQCFRQF